MNNEKLLRELEEKKLRERCMQKKIIICTAAVMLICAVIYAFMLICESGWFVSTEKIEPQRYIFYPDVDYSYDIMTDKSYKRLLSQEPLISLCNNDTGVTTSLSPDEYTKNGDAVTLLTGLVLAVQRGDCTKYNSYFSDAYLISVGKEKALSSDNPSEYENYSDAQFRELGLEDGFTMQMIYGVVITSVSEVRNPDTGITTCNYRLRYMIHRNNGTLRLDMGSDCYREQTFIMMNSQSDAALKIVSVTGYVTDATRTVTHGWRIAAAVSGAVIVTAAIVTGAVLYIVKTGKKTKKETEE